MYASSVLLRALFSMIPGARRALSNSYSSFTCLTALYVSLGIIFRSTTFWVDVLVMVGKMWCLEHCTKS
jgi:hypothetical protein